jgi:DNA polymerase
VRVLHRDYETRSVAPIKSVGAAKYAADPSTRVICCAYAVDAEPVQLWVPGDPVPDAFAEAARDPGWLVVAHNDAFEAAIEQYILAPRYGWPPIPIEQHRCTQAMALAAGLPARLSTCADVLELANRKDGAGERLMHQMSRPRRPRKGEDAATVHWFDDPERLERLYAYCKQDLEVERELFRVLPPLSPSEQTLWRVSCKINQRGFYIDRPFVAAARAIADAAGPDLNSELAELTGGAVTRVSLIVPLLKWLQQQGCTLRKLNKDAITRQLEQGGLTPRVRRALELRQGGAQAATKKIDALLARAGEDGRVRGSFRFHGAATGRWSGEGPQPQNLKRPVDDPEAAIAAVATGDYAHVKGLYPRPLEVVGDCSRPMIAAAPGHVLIGGDLSSIESRILAHLAGEEWKLDSYRRFDATRDPRDEPYCITACKIFRVPDGSFNDKSPERKIGKTCDLAFGYQGGLGAWRNFEPDRFTDDEVKAFKESWRAAHPKIKDFWKNIDIAAWTAVRERGARVRCGVLTFTCAGMFLKLRLPSGRIIHYPHPRIIGDEREQRVVFADNAGGRFEDCRHGQGAYGGIWTQNAVSGIARDILAEAMLRVEAAQLPIVLHVHDELVCEVPEDFDSLKDFTRLLTRKPAWACDLPIAAKAWKHARYCK